MPSLFTFIKRWWFAPVIVIAALAVLAVVFRYQSPDYNAIKERQAAAVRELAGAFAKPDLEIKRVRMVRKGVLSMGGGNTQESVITTTFTAMGDGWFLRRDDWRDKFDQALLFEQRILTWRGLFAVQVEERAPAPLFFNVVFGSLGWFTETANTTSISLGANFPSTEGSEFTVVQQRTANTDGETVGHAPTTYQRTTRCVRDKAIRGTDLHESLRGELRQVRCTSSKSSDKTETMNTLVELIPDTLFTSVASRVPSEQSYVYTVQSLSIER